MSFLYSSPQQQQRRRRTKEEGEGKCKLSSSKVSICQLIGYELKACYLYSHFSANISRFIQRDKKKRFGCFCFILFFRFLSFTICLLDPLTIAWNVHKNSPINIILIVKIKLKKENKNRIERSEREICVRRTTHTSIRTLSTHLNEHSSFMAKVGLLVNKFCVSPISD